jgi:hypothetical protein
MTRTSSPDHAHHAAVLTPHEEAQLLGNVLCEPDDQLSRRLLSIHYESIHRCASSDAK